MSCWLQIRTSVPTIGHTQSKESTIGPNRFALKVNVERSLQSQPPTEVHHSSHQTPRTLPAWLRWFLQGRVKDDRRHDCSQFTSRNKPNRAQTMKLSIQQDNTNTQTNSTVTQTKTCTNYEALNSTRQHKHSNQFDKTTQTLKPIWQSQTMAIHLETKDCWLLFHPMTKITTLCISFYTPQHTKTSQSWL